MRWAQPPRGMTARELRRLDANLFELSRHSTPSAMRRARGELGAVEKQERRAPKLEEPVACATMEFPRRQAHERGLAHACCIG